MVAKSVLILPSRWNLAIIVAKTPARQTSGSLEVWRGCEKSPTPGSFWLGLFFSIEPLYCNYMMEGDQNGVKRLFIALPVEGSLRDEALAWQAGHVGWPVSWLSGDHLHITVVAPWFETEVDKVINKLDDFAKTPHQSFFIDFFKVVFGPNRQAPRLVWAEGNPPRSLLKLKDDLEIALNRHDPRF